MTEPTRRLPFFVYGTLRRDCGNHSWALDGRTASETAAVLSGGRMYDNHGGFPYVALDTDQNKTIVGEVMAIDDENYIDVLRTLDALEGYSPNRPVNHYERVIVTVDLETGGQVEAYTYVAGGRMVAEGHLDSLPPVPSGDWKTYSETEMGLVSYR